jgi:ADP-ribose pyrophosphatase
VDDTRGTRLAHETIYTGRVFTVDRDRVRLPKGMEATLEVVRHTGSVVLLPMPDPGHVILVKQYRYAIDRWVWELAAGTLEPGEDPVAGALRECEEETGLEAGEAGFLGAFYPTPGYCDECMNFFRLTRLAPPAGRPPASPDPDEDIRTKTFSIGEVRQMIAGGGIVDLKTVAGISLIPAPRRARGSRRARPAGPAAAGR